MGEAAEKLDGDEAEGSTVEVVGEGEAEAVQAADSAGGPNGPDRSGRWHHHIPHGAAMALGPNEVARQSRLVEGLIEDGRTTSFDDWIASNVSGKRTDPEEWIGNLSK